jgi:hypothetical protein
VFKPLNLTPHALHCTHKQQRTLGQLSRARMALVAVCRSCKHRRVLYMPRLIERFEPAALHRKGSRQQREP